MSSCLWIVRARLFRGFFCTCSFMFTWSAFTFTVRRRLASVIGAGFRVRFTFGAFITGAFFTLS